MSIEGGGVPRPGPQRGFLRPRRIEKQRTPVDASKPVVRRVPTFEENLERLPIDVAKMVAKGTIVTLDAMILAAENGFTHLENGARDLGREIAKSRQHKKKRPSRDFLRVVKSVADGIGEGVALGTLGPLAVGAAFVAPSIFLRTYNEVYAEQDEQERAERIAEIVQRIDDAHDRAGKVLRAQKDMQKEFKAEQIDAVADALEAYSSRKVFEVYAHKSGLSLWEVASRNRVEDVRCYSQQTLDAFLDHEEHRGVLTKEQIAELREESKNYGGYYSSGTIYLNVSEMVKGVTAHDDIQARTLDLLHHENGHGFLGYWAVNMKDNDGMDRFSEGATELFSNIVTRELSIAKKDPFTGYITGETASAAVVYESLSASGKQTMWSSYVHADVSELNVVYNKKFGDAAFGNMLYQDDLSINPHASAWIARAGIIGYSDHDLREAYMEVASLDRALQNTGDDWAEVTQRANAHLGTGLIVPIRGENLNGVLVVSNQSKNELTGGLLRLDGGQGRRIALLEGWTNNGLLVLPGTNAAYLQVDLDAYSLTRKDLEDQSFEQRGAAVVKMLRQHRSALLHFREME